MATLTHNDFDATKTAKRIGERIQSRRTYLGISQWELAIAIGKARQASIAHYEDGVYNVSAVDLAKIADALRCRVEYFYGDVPTVDDGDDLTALATRVPPASRALAIALLNAVIEQPT